MKWFDDAWPIEKPVDEGEGAKAQLADSAAVPKYDVMERAQLPPIDGIAIECRETPSAAGDLAYVISVVAGGLITVFLIKELILDLLAPLVEVSCLGL